jgi:hypothetical protein
MKIRSNLIVLTLLAVISFAVLAEAQWVFLGRKAIGAIHSITNKDQGYEMATVIIEADANRIFLTALSRLKANSNIHISRRDDVNRNIEFTEGAISAEITITSIQSGLSQVMVASQTGAGNDTATTLFIIQKILQVCESMGVRCTQTK